MLKTISLYSLSGIETVNCPILQGQRRKDKVTFLLYLYIHSIYPALRVTLWELPASPRHREKRECVVRRDTNTSPQRLLQYQCGCSWTRNLARHVPLFSHFHKSYPMHSPPSAGHPSTRASVISSFMLSISAPAWSFPCPCSVSCTHPTPPYLSFFYVACTGNRA